MGYNVYIRYALLLGAVLFTLVIAKEALLGAVRQIPNTPGQHIQTVVQFISGLLSLLVVLTRFFWRAWHPHVHMAWTWILTLAAGLSGLVWGPPMPHIALLFAALAYLVARGIRWGFDLLP